MMRAGLLAIVIVGCGPRVSPAPPSPDDELDHRTGAPTTAASSERPEAPRQVAAPGKGLRTGSISRARLDAVLDAGPASFLRQIEVTPRLAGDRFVGWQLVQVLDPDGPLRDVDVMPGDVLRTVNRKPIARPEELQALWDSLRTSNAVIAELWRDDRKLELSFTVDPAVAQRTR